MNALKRRKFTLIELIAVIIILAVIAVVAIPKYLDLAEDAEFSAADGVYGAVQGATSMAYADRKLNNTAYPSSIINGYLGEQDAEGWTGAGLTISRDLDGDGTNETITVVNGDGTVPPTVTKSW